MKSLGGGRGVTSDCGVGEGANVTSGGGGYSVTESM